MMCRLNILYIYVAPSNGTLLSCDGPGSKYLPVCIEGDIIDMYYNSDTLSLGYKINGKDYGEALKVDKCRYRAAICMYYEGDSLRLMDR